MNLSNSFGAKCFEWENTLQVQHIWKSHWKSLEPSYYTLPGITTYKFPCIFLSIQDVHK